MSFVYLEESGFMARGGSAPRVDAPEDWMVWHFTHAANLGAIVQEGALLSATSIDPVVSVANRGVKERRASVIVDPDGAYPESVVSDHVPFYIAAKSPMLYVVDRGHPDYEGGCDELVFFGVALGDLADEGVVWCASDQNASTQRVAFSRDLTSLGSFVDFDLLCRRLWRNTPDDPDRMSRRAAEVLVLDRVPLEMVRVVVTKNEMTLARAHGALQTVGGERQYHVVRDLFY